MTATTFGKVLSGLFGLREPVSAPTAPAPVVVGQGGRNERQVVIAGEARLFRDEGDVVVQFRPAFDYQLRDTPVGMKLVPSLEPHWAVVDEHPGPLRDAIAAAIKAAASPVAREREAAEAERPRAPVQVKPATTPVVIENAAPALVSSAKASGPHRTERPHYGVIAEWGEREFPDGKRPGKTYESFCLTLESRGQTRLLQGEGLRDAIAETHCRIGDRVEVRRLGKTKVPAVNSRGEPILDGTGAQVLWDKWLWSIKKKS
ncbi:hypothetical protein LJR267_010969 [Paraburkholderia hospita]|uniref:hypothetical protein n=1 Tax=Paraburkholderia hospita TaxID=169430 RepID=UPI000B341EBF|nr:hypothetical protein [Paraburkholderia hospita]OUL91151.1 hypothetical protein CA601_13795 [Paraburkholderia hospita]